jgi:hypothetical protein
VDIMPTVNELAGADPTPPEPIHGRSFAGVVQGKTRVHRKHAVCASHLPWAAGSLSPTATIPFATDGKWGYTPLGPDGKAELYDLENDPLAEKDLAKRYPVEVRAMRQKLLQHVAELDAPEAVGAALGGMEGA